MDSNDKGEMPWLYDQNSTKPKDEDYLLGKAVGKELEGTEGQINAVEYDCTPASIFASQVGHQVDLQRKLQEDPLISLRMREVDSRKKILDNPLKMREVQRYIEKLKKKKHKKEKKHKKHKKRRGSDSEDDDLDAKLLEKLRRKINDDGEDGWVPKDSTVQSEPPKPSRAVDDRSRKRHHHQHHERDRHRGRRDSSSDSDNQKSSRYGGRRRSRSRDGRRGGRRFEDKNRSSSSGRAKGSSMNEEEKAKKLQEMMDNAQWREDNRSKNVKRCREKEKGERLAAKEERYDESFVKNQLLKAADSSSVEKRLQSNRHNIQRGASAMSENFARR